jgi:hypothetical protein
VAVFVGLPGGIAWAVRRARIEGRSLPRAVAGWLIFLARPRGGRVAGRAYRPARSALLARHLAYVAELDPDLGVPVPGRSRTPGGRNRRDRVR